MTIENEALTLKKRFRGYFPVVVDVETAGFNAQTDALLEICAVTLKMDEDGVLHPASTIHFHVEPFEGANLEKEALEFNGIRDPYSPLRGAVSEQEALKESLESGSSGLSSALSDMPVTCMTRSSGMPPSTSVFLATSARDADNAQFD